jgi:hypothetical protein
MYKKLLAFSFACLAVGCFGDRSAVKPGDKSTAPDPNKNKTVVKPPKGAPALPNSNKPVS